MKFAHFHPQVLGSLSMYYYSIMFVAINRENDKLNTSLIKIHLVQIMKTKVQCSFLINVNAPHNVWTGPNH